MATKKKNLTVKDILADLRERRKELSKQYRELGQPQGDDEADFKAEVGGALELVRDLLEEYRIVK